jgi:hypothetical protein
LSEQSGFGVKQEPDERLISAYMGQGDAMLEEVLEILDGQAWPPELQEPTG